MYLPTRWKDRSSFPNSCLAPIGEARRSVLPARETGAARKSKPSPRHLKANATLAGMLTPRLNLTETRGCSTIRLITLIRGPERGTGAPAKTLSALVGKPLGNTLERCPPSGLPQVRQHALQRAAGGVSARIRNGTQQNATVQTRNRTQTGTLDWRGTRGT